MVNKRKLRNKIQKVRFDPIDRDILRVLSKTKLSTTPSKIAEAIRIHPTTAKHRIQAMNKLKLINCKPRGNRLLCKANLGMIKKKRKLF